MADRNESLTANGSPAGTVLATNVDPTSARFEANMRFLADLMSQVRNEAEKICEGGGTKAIESQHSKKRLTARERIGLLADPGTFFELGLYAAHEMYEEWGGAPAAGVITGMARVQTRLVMIIANDATVKAGASWLNVICSIAAPYSRRAMKTLLFRCLALFATCVSFPAFAADMPLKALPPLPALPTTLQLVRVLYWRKCR